MEINSRFSLLFPIPFDQVSENQRLLASQFQEHGIVYLKRFLDRPALKEVLDELSFAEEDAVQDLQDRWQGQKICFFTKNPVKSEEKGPEEDYVVTPYFQQSDQAAHVFFEEIEDRLVVNRIGHGLHLHARYSSIQSAIYRNENLNKMLMALGYREPICLLSVYIPKFPKGAGSEVRPHQESTFANTDPLSAGVLWVALEDATIENACMWGLPGSHRLPLKFISKVDHVKKKRVYVQVSGVDIPEFNEVEGTYVPLEVKAGDAIFFHGNFVHCSPRNLSVRSRRALTFQFVETSEVTFSDFNWIKEPNERLIYRS